MRIVLQRVSKVSVEVEKQTVGKIDIGLLVLVGFMPQDTEEDFLWMIKKILGLRIFPDENQIMNLSITDISGELLIVSQFTLYALTKKGNRPSYMNASPPELAQKQYNHFLKLLSENFTGNVQTGIFGADMKVSLLNDGPVTITIDSKNKS